MLTPITGRHLAILYYGGVSGSCLRTSSQGGKLSCGYSTSRREAMGNGLRVVVLLSQTDKTPGEGSYSYTHHLETMEAGEPDHTWERGCSC